MNYKKLFIIVFLVSYLSILPSEQRLPVSTMVKILRCMRGKVIDTIMIPKAARIFPFAVTALPFIKAVTGVCVAT